MSSVVAVFFMPLFQAVITSVFVGGVGFYWWIRRKDREKSDELWDNVSTSDKRLSKIEDKQLLLEKKHTELGEKFVTEPRVKEIVDESVNRIVVKMESMESSINGKFGQLQDGMTEILLHQATESGYKQAMKEIKDLAGKGD